jgi:hypothetical protein
MATSLSELTMLMNYEDRQRARLESQERQDSRDNWSRFTTMAAHNVATADDITDLAKNETDLTVLDELSKKLEGTLTGVNFVDQVINVKGAEIDNRKNTVVAVNRINDQINSLNEKLGNEQTAGVKEVLDTLDKQYRNMVSSMTDENKILLANKLKNVKQHFNLQLWKGEFDTDKETPGNQFPKWMGEHEKSFYTQTVEPGVRVAEGSGNFVSAISQMSGAFSAMRDEKTAYETRGQARTAAAVTAKKKENVIKSDELRSVAFNELETMAGFTNDAFSDLDPDLPNEWNFKQTLTNVGVHVASKTGKNLKTLDAKGMLKALDHSIILNSGEDYKNIGNTDFLNAYVRSGDPLNRDHLEKMEILIEMNTFVGEIDKKTGVKKQPDTYNINFGIGEKAHRGMFSMINTRKKLLEIINTPGMLIQQGEEVDSELPNIGSQIQH